MICRRLPLTGHFVARGETRNVYRILVEFVQLGRLRRKTSESIKPNARNRECVESWERVQNWLSVLISSGLVINGFEISGTTNRVGTTTITSIQMLVLKLRNEKPT